MNKLFTKIAALALGAAMVVGVGVSVGSKSKVSSAYGVEEAAYTLTPVTGDNNAYATAEDITCADSDSGKSITWSVMGNSKDYAPWRIGGKQITNAVRPIYSKNAIAEDITKVSITSGTSSLTSVSLGLSVHNNASDAASGNNAIASFTETTAANFVNTTKTFTKTDSTSWAGKFFRITYTCTYTSNSNKFITFVEAQFIYNKETSKPNMEVTDASSVGGPFSVLKGSSTLTLYAEKENDSGNYISSGLTWTSGDTNVFTVNSQPGYAVITGVGVGEAFLTVKHNDYNDATAKIIVSNGELIGIEFTSASMTKTSYYSGMVWDPSGLAVNALYESGDEVDVTDQVTWSYSDAYAQTSKTITVTATLGSETATKQVSVTVSEPVKMTVAQARAAIDAGTGTQGAVVEGYISQIDTYNENYHWITYWVSDDGTTTDQLEAYHGYGLQKANFAAKSDLILGDKVVIYGDLTKYGSTYEFGADNYLLSLSRKEISGISVSGSMTKTEYYTNEEWSPSGFVVTLNYTDSTSETLTTGVTWTYNPAKPSSTSTTSVTATAHYSAGGQDYSSNSEPQSVTITVPPVEKYGLYEDDLVAGKYIIVGSGTTNAMKAAISSSRFENGAVTIENNVITGPDASVIWDIQPIGNTGHWSMYNSSVQKYASTTTTNNQGKLDDDTSDDKAKWDVSYSGGLFDFTNVGRASVSNHYLRNNGTYGWGVYATGTGVKATLYKLNYLPKAWASFNYVDGTPDKTSYMVGESFNPDGLEIHAVYTEPSIYPEEDITSQIVWDELEEGTTATGTWGGHEVTITGLTISSFTPVSYTKVTSLDQIAVGSEVIIGAYKDTSPTGWRVLAGITGTNKFFNATETTVTGENLNTTSDTTIFTVEADKYGYYLKTGNKYLNRSGNDNVLGDKDISEDRLSCWTFSFTDGQFAMKQGNQNFQFNKSSPRFKCYTTSQTAINIYVKQAATPTEILRTYAARYLLLENESLDQIPSGPTQKEGTACLGTDGPYRTAKTALTTGEFSAYNSAFQGSNDTIVSNARLRYVSWAAAYGDFTPYASTVGSGRIVLDPLGLTSGNPTTIIIIVSVIGVSALGGFFFLRKRKEI